MAKDKVPIEIPLPDAEEAYTQVMEVAKRIKLGRQINHLKCPKDGCYTCSSLERIVNGEGELVGVSGYNQDVYILNDQTR